MYCTENIKDKLNLYEDFDFRLYCYCPCFLKKILATEGVKSDPKIAISQQLPRFCLNPWNNFYNFLKSIKEFEKMYLRKKAVEQVAFAFCYRKLFFGIVLLRMCDGTKWPSFLAMRFFTWVNPIKLVKLRSDNK